MTRDSSDSGAEIKNGGDYAPRWLSGGRNDVLVKDNPTAIAYYRFVERVSAIFLNEQVRHDKEVDPND